MPALIDIPSRPDVRVAHSVRRDGDFRPENSLEARGRIAPGAWTQLAEDHGVTVRRVDRPGDHDGSSGDVLLTNAVFSVLGVWAADCAPIVIVGRDVVCGVHAGWRGVRDGVIEAAIAAVRDAGDEPNTFVIGAHIRPCCYEFSVDDLTSMIDRFDASVAAIDRHGRSALDMGACIRHVLAELSPEASIIDVGHCTGCRADLFFSHRARGESERHVLAVWRTAS